VDTWGLLQVQRFITDAMITNKSMKTSLLILFASCALVGACQERAGEPSSDRGTPIPSEQASAPGVTEASLLDAFRSNDFDRVIGIMNKVKGTRYPGHLVPVLTRLWDGKELNGIEEKFVNHPRIKIEIANALAQIERNGFKGLDKGAYSRYAKGLVLSEDPDVALQAALVLGIAGTVDDLPILESIALQGDSNRYRAAIIAIAENCATAAPFIDNLEKNLKEQWRKEFLRKTWEEFQSFRVCERR